MPKTHTKINQLAGETLKGFAYANNTDKELVDDVQAIRDEVTHYTEIIRDYDSTVQDLQFTGTGPNDLSIGGVVVQRPYTFTIDSQNNYAGIYFQGLGLNDALVDYASYAGQRPLSFQFAIEAVNDELSTGNGGFTGTPINGETFTTGSGATFKFISYDSGTDTIYAYNVSTSPAPAPTDVFTGLQSGASITLVNTFTPGTNEVGLWVDSIGNNGVWSIQPTVAYTIGTGAESLDVTFPAGGHTQGDLWITYFVQGAVIINILSPSGPFTTGETITQASNPGASAVIGYDNGGNISLINIVGQLNIGASSGIITGSLSGQTATLNTLSSYADTFTWTDGITTENQVVITTSNQILDSGNITIQFGSNASHVVGDQWQLTFPIINIETGFETQQITFTGVPFPLEGSSIYSEDVNGKVSIGTFDLTPFGGDSKTTGIVSVYTDGSQSIYTQGKDNANLNIFDTNTNKYIYVYYSGDEYRLNGSDGSQGYNLRLSGTQFRYFINGQSQVLPATFGTSGQMLYTDGSGTMYWDNQPTPLVTTTNGVTLIGSDIGLGGSLAQNTNINSMSNEFRLHGTDIAGNDTGIVYSPSIFNGLSGYAGVYSNSLEYNKAGVYTTGLNQHRAVLGFYDGTGTISNASFTIHEHSMNLAESRKKTRLCESTSGFSVYSDEIDLNGATIQHVENYQNSNPFSPANGLLVSKSVNFSSPNKVQLVNSQDSLNNRVVEEIHDITSNVQKRLNVSDGVNTQILRITTTDIETSQYPDTRDDSGTNYPTSFLYTDGVGKFQTTQLGKGTYSLAAYADDTAAATGGVLPGRLYQTDGTGAAPLNVAGILMVKQ